MANQRIVLQERYPELKQIGISCLGYYNNQTTHGGLRKEHHGSCYEICFLASGMQPYCIYEQETSGSEESKLYRLYGGEVFVTRPYEYHSTGEFHQLRGTLYWVQIDSECPTLLNQTKEHSDLLKEALTSLKTPIFRVPNSISSHFREAFDLFMVKDKMRWFRACNQLALFILELADFYKKEMEKNYGRDTLSTKILEAVSFIQNNLLNPELDVQMIADYLHFSRAYIMTAFRNEVGMTMHEYILRSKIEHACELLDTYSITETAFLLNFSSSQHFSSVFKEHMGMTPREFVKQNIVLK